MNSIKSIKSDPIDICLRISVLPWLIILSLTGCDNRSQEEKYPSLAKSYPPTELYPQGYADVQMGDYLMRVPKEVAPVGPNGNFSVYASWPEFEFVRAKQFRSSPTQSAIDKIEMFFFPPRRGPKDDTQYQQGNNAKARKIQALENLEGKKIESTEFPGFWEIRSSRNGKPEYYMSMNLDIVDPLGLPKIFRCSTFNLDVEWDQVDRDYTKWDQADWDNANMIIQLPRCEAGSYWPDGHRVRIRFHRKHMQDVVKIYQKVIALHDSFVINQTQQIRQQGE